MHLTKKLSLDGIATGWLIEPMVAALTEAYAESPEIWGHVGRVARFAVAFGRRMDISGEALMSLQCAALLHEIGKLSVDADLINKTAPLERDEWYSITKHATLLSNKLKERALPASIVSIAQAHHEHFDGTGYPLGLVGDEIPLAARVLSIADAYDTMASTRPYRSARKPAQVLAEFGSEAGKQFDPELVRRLWPLLEVGITDLYPPRRMRLVSSDPDLYRQLWFAVTPHGWDLEAWPAELVSFYPPYLSDTLGHLSDDPGRGGTTITLVDRASAVSLPLQVVSDLPADAVWIDLPGGSRPGLASPLDLRDILALLYSTGRDAWSSTPITKIKVLLADPYHVFRQVLSRYLADLDDVDVVAEVSSPLEYRKAISAYDFDVAIVASDLFSGTHTTSPLDAGDIRLQQAEVSLGVLRQRPTVVLVADEDVEDYPVGLYDAPLTGGLDGALSNFIHIHRGAPAERLVEAIKGMVKVSDMSER